MSSNYLEAIDKGNAIAFPVSMLYTSIRANYYDGDYDKIKDSIYETGHLTYPIVVWQTTMEEWEKWSLQNEDFIKPSETLCYIEDMVVHVVMCGNNRLSYAHLHGYIFIDAIILTDREEISRHCSRQRKWWRAQNEGK